MKHSRVATLTLLSLLAILPNTYGQQPAAGGQNNGGGGGGGAVAPAQTDLYKSDFVKLGGDATDGLLYMPKTLGLNQRVAIVTNYAVPAAQLANRGYRVVFVRHVNKPGEVSTALDPFPEISRGIEYARKLPGVTHVVVAAWGSGATSMALYADVAARGPAGCQGKDALYPCKTAEATGLAKPDGVVFFDPGPGAGTTVIYIDPAYEGDTRSRQDLDMFAAANGYDIKTGAGTYSTDFQKRYFAAQSSRNMQAVSDAVEQMKNGGASAGDERLALPKGVLSGNVTSLHHPDVTILGHTKRPHMLLKADGTQPVVILKSIRPADGPVGDAAIQKAITPNERSTRNSETVARFLANDAIRTTKDFALTEDDIVGVDWKSSNAAPPGHAVGITVPSLVMTNTCFQFVISSEIFYDNLSSKDKTFVGVEGSEHFFRPCAPQYGDTQKRLFDYVDSWLAKPGRF